MGDMVTDFARRAMKEVRRNVVNIEPRRRRLHRIHRHRYHGFIIPTLPLWANILILVGIVIGALFILGLLIGIFQERSRAKRTNQRMRIGRVFWSGIQLALFLWIPIGIYRLVRYRSFKGKTKAYREIHEEERGLATGETKSFKSSLPGARARGRSDLDADSRYEPMGYAAGGSYNPYSPQLNPGSQRGTPEIDISEGRSRANSAAAELFKPPPPQGSGATSPPVQTSATMNHPPASYAGGGYGAPEH